jgi:hypothetical protein
MHRSHALIALLFAAALVQCADVHVDEDYVCFVPPNCPCGADYEFCDLPCSGEFPADTAFPVSVSVEGCQFEDFSCEVVQTGDFELTIETSWQEPSSSPCFGEETIACDLTWVGCGQTPMLGTGTWMVKYGTSTHAFVVPSAGSTGLDSWKCFEGE